MEIFVITTDEIDDDLVCEYESVYCTNCGACGILGCECWGGCTAMYCKYGDSLINAYEDDKKNSNLWYEMLMALGVYNAFDIDLDRIKKIASRGICFKGFKLASVKDIISDNFNKLKDIREE